MKALGVEPKCTLPTINTRSGQGAQANSSPSLSYYGISILRIPPVLTCRLFFILIAQLALHHTPPLVTGNNKGGKERKRMERKGKRGMMDKSEIQG
jgi:hypothetical protein